MKKLIIYLWIISILLLGSIMDYTLPGIPWDDEIPIKEYPDITIDYSHIGPEIEPWKRLTHKDREEYTRK